MKAILTFTFILFISPIFSQSITVTAVGGSCDSGGPSVLNFYEVRNGKNSYALDIGGGNISIIEWTGSRWENNVRNSTTDVLQLGPLFYNNTETPLDPPCFIESPDWVSDGPCAVDQPVIGSTMITDLTGSCFVTPVPTLSQWGLIILGFIFMIFGVLFLVKQKNKSLDF